MESDSIFFHGRRQPAHVSSQQPPQTFTQFAYDNGLQEAEKEHQEEDEGEQEQEQEQPPVRKRGRPRVNKTASNDAWRNPKIEINNLRSEVARLEPVLQQLKRQRQRGMNHPSCACEVRAFQQAQLRANAMHENVRLRSAMQELEALRDTFRRALETPCPTITTLGSVQENEWKDNRLSPYPIRRRWNAERIMGRLYESLSSREIRSGLVDVQRNRRYVKRFDEQIADAPFILKVKSHQRIGGHYQVIADRIWRGLVVPTLTSFKSIHVQIEHVETFGSELHFIKSAMFMGNRQITKTNAQLHRRMEETDRVVILIKSIRETEAATANVEVAQNMDGWISIERSVQDLYGVETCNLRSSFSIEFSSLTVECLLLMQLIPRPSYDQLHDEQAALHRGIQARAFVAEFVQELQWNYSLQIEKLAALPLRTV